MGAGTECVKARFMDNNHVEADHTVITASSATSGFPATNLANRQRTKYWRASGHFEIYSGNDTIYIDDGGALIGTIAAGSYTGTTLATAIETELNSISSGWSVSYSGSYLFTISHPTATIEFSKTTDAIWDTIGYTGVVDVTPLGPLAADEIRIHSVEYVDFDLGVSTFEILFFGFIGSVCDAISISRNATVRLQADNVPLSLAITPPVDITLTRDDRGYMEFLDDVSGGTFYRYWRVLIEDRTNGNGPTAIQMGYAYVGDYLTFTTTNLARGFDKGLVDPSTVQQTDSGREYFNKRCPYHVFGNLQVQLPLRAEKDAWEQFVNDHGRVEPFFMSIDPGLKISTDLVDLTMFVNFQTLPTSGHVYLDRFNIQNFSVREVV